MQNEDQNRLYYVVDDYISSDVIKRKNRSRSWAYGYNKEYDIVVISKTGQIGEIIVIQGLIIALPAVPSKIKK